MRDIKFDPLLTPADEELLAARIEAGVFAAALRRAGSPAAVEATDRELAAVEREGVEAWHRFISANYRLVRMITMPAARRASLDDGELFQEGVLGLMEALRRFDHRRGVKFATFALPWIRMRVAEASATRFGSVGLPPGRARSWRQARAIRDDLEGRLGRTPEAAEVASAWGRPIEFVRELLAFEPAGALVLDEGERPVDEAETDAGDEVRRLMSGLPAELRLVLEFRFGFVGREPLSLGQVADTLGISASTVRRREQAALDLLRESPRLPVAA